MDDAAVLRSDPARARAAQPRRRPRSDAPTLPGIGEWTAQYIAMRGLGDPDAFPTGDLGLRIAAGDGDRISARALTDLAERWRPWRAYAAMHLWQSLADRAGN